MAVYLFSPFVNAYASDTVLTCAIKDDFADVLRETSQSFGISVYKINLKTKKIAQTVGALKEEKIITKNIDDIEILFMQNGDINLPSINEKIITSISRINGKFTQKSNFFDAKNNQIPNDKLGEIFKSLNLATLSINSVYSGDCASEMQKF